MLTRTRLLIGSAAAGLALTAAVATSGIIAAPTAAQAAWLDVGSYRQIAQGQPSNEPKRKPDGQRPKPTAEQIKQMQERRQQREQQFIAALAKNLNLSPDAVKQGLEKTRNDLKNARIAEIQQAVKDGKISQERANKMIQRIQSGGHGPGR